MSGALPKDWSAFKDLLAALPRNDVHRIIKFGRRELATRYQEAEALKERLAGAADAMANFMAGVTWALACRAALRESKGHPPIGKRPQSGEMWLPREVLTAVRSQVKRRGWHPITANDVFVVLHELAAEHRASTRPAPPLSIEAELNHGIEVARFVIPMAQGNAAIHLDRRAREDLFDLGGES